MGVPIGSGGQKFGWAAADRIEEFSSVCPNLSMVELDGGLTFDILKNIKKKRINRFSGWSLVSDKSPSKVLLNARDVKGLI